MANFILKDTNRFYLKGTKKRFVHLATIHYGVREFMYFADTLQGTCYIEEITGGSLIQVKDEELWSALLNFVNEKGIFYTLRKNPRSSPDG